MNDISFRIINGLGRQRANEDHVSGMVLNIATPNTAPYVVLSSLSDFNNCAYKHDNFARYQVSEFFRLAGEGAMLYVFHATGFTIDSLRFANGKIRQLAVLVGDLSAIATVVATWQAFANASATNRCPLQILLAPAVATSELLANCTDLRTLNAPNVSVLVSGFGANTPALGAVVGLMAARKVSESIAWVEKGRLDTGGESVYFTDSQLLSTKSEALLTLLDAKGYLYIGDYPNYIGKYLNDSHTCTVATDDYAYIETNRVIQKCRRELRNALLPLKNSPVIMDKKGVLEIGFQKYIESVAEKPLEIMQRSGEMSQFKVSASGATALTTGEIVIQIQIIPIATLRKPVVEIGFTTTINEL